MQIAAPAAPLEIWRTMPYRSNMVLSIGRKILVALMIFAFIAGMTMQAAPSAAALGVPGSPKADADCRYMAIHQKDIGEPKQMPRSGIDPDCVKQMECLGTATLPLRPGEPPTPVAFSKVTYCLLPAPRFGGSVKPELLPPIGM